MQQLTTQRAACTSGRVGVESKGVSEGESRSRLRGLRAWGVWGRVLLLLPLRLLRLLRSGRRCWDSDCKRSHQAEAGLDWAGFDQQHHTASGELRRVEKIHK